MFQLRFKNRGRMRGALFGVIEHFCGWGTFVVIIWMCCVCCYAHLINIFVHLIIEKWLPKYYLLLCFNLCVCNFKIVFESSGTKFISAPEISEFLFVCTDCRKYFYSTLFEHKKRQSGTSFHCVVKNGMYNDKHGALTNILRYLMQYKNVLTIPDLDHD